MTATMEPGRNQQSKGRKPVSAYLHSRVRSRDKRYALTVNEGPLKGRSSGLHPSTSKPTRRYFHQTPSLSLSASPSASIRLLSSYFLPSFFIHLFSFSFSFSLSLSLSLSSRPEAPSHPLPPPCQKPANQIESARNEFPRMPSHQKAMIHGAVRPLARSEHPQFNYRQNN